MKNLFFLPLIFIYSSCVLLGGGYDEPVLKEYMRFTIKGEEYEWMQNGYSSSKEFAIAKKGNNTFLISAGNPDKSEEIEISVRTSELFLENEKSYDIFTPSPLDNFLPQVVANVSLNSTKYTSLKETWERNKIGIITFNKTTENYCYGRFNFMVYNEDCLIEVVEGDFYIPIVE